MHKAAWPEVMVNVYRAWGSTSLELGGWVGRFLLLEEGSLGVVLLDLDTAIKKKRVAQTWLSRAVTQSSGGHQLHLPVFCLQQRIRLILARKERGVSNHPTSLHHAKSMHLMATAEWWVSFDIWHTCF